MVSEGLWLPWSDTLGRYAPTWPSYGEAMPLSDCKILNRADINAKDWRPVRIPTPRQIEATEYLLAACEAVISAGESENLPIAVYDAIEAAIAKANGEGK